MNTHLTASLIGRWPFYIAVFFSLLPLGAGPDGASEGSFLRQLVWGSIFTCAALVIIRRPERRELVINALPLSLLCFVLYVSVSIAWSPAPYVSFKRALQVLGIVVLAASLVAGGGSTYRIHRLATPVLALVMVLAIAFAATFPSFAFSDIGFRAFMATKNNFGQFAVIAVIFAAGYMAIERRNKLACMAIVIVGLAGLGLSRSVTASASLLAVVSFLSLRAFIRSVLPGWWRFFLGTAMVFLVIIYLILILTGFPSLGDLLEVVFQATGRDLSLSGRTDLWGLMWIEAMKHPWLGTGYGGFWLGLDGMSGQIAYLVRWGYPGQAHNGYLDIFNELGLVGGLLLMAFLASHAHNLAMLSKKDRGLYSFHAAIFIAILTMNIAEATILRTTHLWWMLFTASVFEVAALTKRGNALVSRGVAPLHPSLMRSI
jgi:O-antigen ligase